MNIFEVGLKAYNHMNDMQRVAQLIRPTLDAYNAAPDLLPTIQKAIKLAKPIIDEYAKVEPELVPLVEMIFNDFFPRPLEAATPAAPPPPPSVVRYDVKWLQQSLVKLGVINHLDADGDYGPNTKTTVQKYQQSVVDRGESNWHQSDVDGWAGMKTCAQIYNDLAKL